LRIQSAKARGGLFGFSGIQLFGKLFQRRSQGAAIIAVPVPTSVALSVRFQSRGVIRHSR